MATHLAAHRTTVLAALIGGFVLAGAITAYADDDDWHSEAERPVAPQQQLKDRTAIQAIAAVKPQREQVYAPRSMLPTVQTQRPTDNDTQTATVDRLQH